MDATRKNTSVFQDGTLPHVGDLSHAETRRCGEFFSRKERKDHKAGGPTSVSATIDRSGWKRVRLGEVLTYEQPYPYIVHKAEYVSNGTPVLTPGKTFILGYTTETDGICRASSDAPRILFDDFLTISRLVQFDFKVKSSAVKILLPVSTSHNLRFIFYAMSRLQFELTDHQRHWINQFSKLEIQVPTRQEQDRIADAIDSIDTHISALQSLIAKYEAIKKATVNLLLEPKADWHTSTMGESFDLSRGVVISKNEIERRPGIYPVYSSQSVNDGVLGLIDSYRYDGEYITWTTDGANAGTVFYRHGKFNCTNVCGIAKARIPKMSPAFVALMIAQYAKSYVSYVGNPKLMSNIFAQILFSYPSASEQRKIAEKITAIDKVLADYKAQLEKARQLKAGMMSYFFG